MDFEDLLAALTPEKYSNLQRGVELGKWSDGRPLTDDEKAMAMQLLIAYDARFKPEEERVGYVPAPGKDCDDDKDIIHRE
jgi:uncharacterized protein YeaC (DUF1315 family)